jgi:nitrilase
MDSYPTVRVAAVQTAPVFLDREATLAKVVGLIAEAGAGGARIIGFGENLIPGHPYWYQFHNAYDCRRFEVRYFKNAVEVPGDVTDALGAAARDAGAWVVIGVAEKEPGSYGTIYNTQLFFAPDGSLAGKHRKLVLTNSERLIQHHGDATTLHTYPTEFGRLGGLICGEHFNSLARTALLMEGELFHVASWPALPARKSGTGFLSMDVRVQFTAMEGRIFVISAASVWTPEMLEVLELDDQARGLLQSGGGHSGIVGPDGTYLAGPLGAEEGIVYADLDVEQTVSAKISQDVTGHYQRFDLFELSVNRGER